MFAFIILLLFMFVFFYVSVPFYFFIEKIVPEVFFVKGKVMLFIYKSVL